MSDPLIMLRDIPRVDLAPLPSRLEMMPRLGAAIGSDSLWVKRDDCTGLGGGGNKVRKLEFMGRAMVDGADCIVSGGVLQSNSARQVASACTKLGLECHLGIMHDRPARTEPGYANTGNILLDRLFGAIVHDIPWNEDRNQRLLEIVDQLKMVGRQPYLIPYGASDVLGAVGYALAAEEIVRERPDVAWIVHASGSAGTQAGLLAGLLAFKHSARVIGVDVDAQPERVRKDVCRIGRATSALLGSTSGWQDACVEVAGQWSADSYGIADERTKEAIRLAARLEGIVLDPFYTGKGMAGLIGLTRQGRFAANDVVVWIHRWNAGHICLSRHHGTTFSMDMKQPDQSYEQFLKAPTCSQRTRSREAGESVDKGNLSGAISRCGLDRFSWRKSV